MKLKSICLLAALIFSWSQTRSQNIEGTFALKNVQTGVYVRIKDASTKNGTPIVAYSPVNWKCVTWDFRKQPGGSYQLANLFSQKTLQPAAISSTGATLEEQPLEQGKAGQSYDFLPIEGQTYLIRLTNTNLYLTPSDANGEINSPIILKPKQTPANRLQYWQLVAQDPTM